MSSYSTIFFSFLLISSVIFVSTIGSSYADEIIATSMGFEDSTILELKNSRGNIENIESVRIWLNEDNDFKSFKTEKDWLGKKQLNGVIEFTSQKEVKPGESVKFGIKTVKQNPIVNWKAINSNGEVISSSSTKITVTNPDSNESELNQPKFVAIKDESIFRLIPEQPTSNSEFRVVGENFVPNKNLDFYIQDDFMNTVSIDNDGKILFTSQIPSIINNERTEFILRDSGGNEKALSLRIIETETRDISQLIKLSIGNTPKDVKRGETVSLTGMATPNSTITITSKDTIGNILNIDTIQVGSDGKWSYDSLFAPDLTIGTNSIEIDDGTTTILRNFNVVSEQLINIFSENTMYSPGDIVSFNGLAIPNQKMSIILEDAIGAQIYSRSITVGDSGNVTFDIQISRDSIEGTYILYTLQGNEEGITTFGIGQEPQAILILKPLKLNFNVNEDISILIQGVANGQVSLILVDSANREMFSESINLGPDGREMYKIDSAEIGNGAYTLSAQRGESVDEAKFSVGFTTGSGIITVQTTKTDYLQGESILILGSTGSNSLLEVSITDPIGRMIKKIETFSNQDGVFKIDNFRIPMDGEAGVWKIDAKSGSNFDTMEFNVTSDNNEMIIILEKTIFTTNEIMNITGSGATGSTISLNILNSNGEKIDELTFTAKNNGEYSTIWQIPADILLGEYEITVDDGVRNTTINFTIS